LAMHLLEILYIAGSVVTLIGFAVTLYQITLLKRCVNTLMVDRLRLIVDKVSGIKAPLKNSDPIAHGLLDHVQADLENLRNSLIDVFSIKGAQKN
jgi:hypothetical protein